MSIASTPSPRRTVIAYLIVHDAPAAISFYETVFGANEVVRLADPTGKVMHAELHIGDASVMLADEFPEMGYRSARSLGGSPVSLLLYVDDVDTRFPQALAAGAVETMPVQDHFDGDRRGTLTDPFGHTWLLATRKEDVSFPEMRRRFEAMMNPPSA